MSSERSRVIVVGGGNAGLCAAISAAEAGALVTLIERAPFEQRGGNSRYTAGAMRVAFTGVDDVAVLMPDLTEEQLAAADFGSYDEGAFFDDLVRVTDYRTDPDLAETLVGSSFDTLRWMTTHGVKFAPSYGRQAFRREDGRFRFWGGLFAEVTGGGPGLVDYLTDAARALGVELLYGTRAMSLVGDHRGIRGVVVQDDEDGEVEIAADGVVLAAGGFQANSEWRAKYLGPGWDLAKVRGSRYNTGDGIRMALDIGAAPNGHWSGCHAVGWDRNAPDFGDLAVGDGYQKHSYPLGIMVNARGDRFVDEGADFRNYTYAKYGQEILRQPHQAAWQVFDSKVESLLRDEYRIKEITRVSAPTLEGLAERLDGVDPEGFLRTVREYNGSISEDVQFDPTVKDGRSANLPLPKSNWANALDAPPYTAYQVTCGITFTFGGVRIDTEGRALDDAGTHVAGLYACGEMAGGLFYFNYPGGSGLTAGSVFGRRAGLAAATESALNSQPA